MSQEPMIIASLLSLAIAITCYAISQLQQHHKLRWMNDKKPFGFWGKASHVRKYRHAGGYRDAASRTFYYKLIKSHWIEAWPTSTWLTVSITDGYHFMQFWFFNFLALSLTFALGFDWILLISLLFGIRILHWLVRKLLSK